MDRRKYLSLVGGSLCAVTAGCTGGQDSNNRTTTDSSTTVAAETTPEPTETTSEPTETTEESTTTEAASSQSVALGEVFGGDDLRAVVEGFTTTQQLSEYIEAGQGNDFAIVQLAVKNLADNTDIRIGGYSPVFEASLSDADGYTYENTFERTDTPFVAGTLVPGEVIRGDKVYTVSDDAEELVAKFDFSDQEGIDADTVVVDLSEQADDPTNLEQDLQIDINSVGDTATHSGLSLTVNSVEFTQQENSRNVVVDVTFKNETGGNISSSHISGLWGKDDRGYFLTKDTWALTNMSRGYSTDSDLEPGEERRGKVPFNLQPGEDSVYCSFRFSEYVDGIEEFWELK